MEGLQRSAISFRRQGSSGLVWDDKLISGELKPEDNQDQKDDQKIDLRRSKSDGGNRRVYRTVKVEQAEDPPSPRVSGCGFCSVFGKPVAKTDKKKTGKPMHR
ncbi:unnamed protein product [Amaranthus hypochondriacus]